MPERKILLSIIGKDDTQNAFKGIAKSLGDLGGGVVSAVGTAAKAVAGLAIGGAAAIGGLAAVGVTQAISVESAFAGVIKTTDGLADSTGALTKEGAELKAEFRALSREIPTAVEELMGIGELGGQLGIQKENLLDFTRTIAAMGEATNLTTEAAASEFARLANVMGTSQEDFSRMGSSIVALGNNMATTEADISSFASRIAGAGKIAGVSEADVFGIAAAFSSVGIEAEAGGTAVQKVLMAMNAAVTSGSEDLGLFASAAGMTAAEFADTWQDDAAGAFAAFVEGLGVAGDDAMGILSALGLEDQRLIRSFLSLGNAGGLLTDALEMSNDAWAENTALAAEAAQRYATTESMIQTIKNTFKDFAVSAGEALLPFLRDAVVALQPFMSEFAERLPELMQNYVVPALERVVEVGGQVVGFVTQFVGQLQAGVDPLTAFRDTLAEFIPPETMAQIDGVVERITAFVAQVQVFVNEHSAGLTAALYAMAAALAVVVAVGAALAFAAWFNPVIAIIGAVILAIGALAFAWTEDWGGIQTKTRAVIDWLMPYIQGALDWISGLWTAHGDTVLGSVQQAWEWVQAAFTTALEWVQIAVKDALEWVREFWAQNGERILELVGKWWSAIEQAWQTGVDLVKGIFEAFGLALKGDWYGFGNKIFEIADTFLKNLFELFRRQFDFLKSLFGAVIDGLVSLWRSFDWAGIGKAVIDGIIAGVKGGVGALKNAVKAAAKAALDAAKGFLGIKSPSKMMMDQVGLPIALGIAAGIDKGTPKVLDSAEKMLKSLTSIMTSITTIGGYEGTTGLLGAADAFSRDFDTVMSVLMLAVEGITEEMRGFMYQAGVAWGVAKDIFAPVKGIVDALLVIAQYRPAEDIVGAADAFSADFGRAMSVLMLSVEDIDEQMRGFMDQAGMAMVLAGKLFAPVKGIIDGVMAVAGYRPAEDIVAASGAFASDMNKAMFIMKWALAHVDEQIRGMIDGAGAAMASAGKLFAPVKGIVDGVMALAEYKPAEDIVASTGAFVSDMNKAMFVLKWALAHIDEQIGEMLGVAAKAMTTAQALFTPVNAIIDALAVLAEYAPAEDIVASTGAFASDMNKAMFVLKWAMSYVDEQMQAAISEATKAMQSASALFGTVKDIMDGITALAERAESEDSLDGLLAWFQDAIGKTIAALQSAVVSLEGNGLDAATRFYNAAVAIASAVHGGMGILSAIGGGGMGGLPGSLIGWTEGLTQTFAAMNSGGLSLPALPSAAGAGAMAGGDRATMGEGGTQTLRLIINHREPSGEFTERVVNITLGRVDEYLAEIEV